MMDRKPVRSSSVVSVGYEEPSRLLEVEFKTGAVYEYREVPSSEYAALMGAASVGGYLNASIKGRYRFRKLR